MAVEELSVVKTGTDSVQVNTRKQSHCQHCVARSACGLHLLNRQETFSLPVPGGCSESFQTDETLSITINDLRLIQLSFLQYLFPVALILVVTGVTGEIVATTESSELWVVFSALFALMIGLALVPEAVKIMTGNPMEFLQLEIRKRSHTVSTDGKQEG